MKKILLFKAIALVVFFLPPLEPPRDPPLELLLEFLDELPAALLRLEELLDPFLEEEALLDEDLDGISRKLLIRLDFIVIGDILHSLVEP